LSAMNLAPFLKPFAAGRGKDADLSEAITILLVGANPKLRLRTRDDEMQVVRNTVNAIHIPDHAIMFALATETARAISKIDRLIEQCAMLIAIIVLGQLNVRFRGPANTHYLIASLALDLLKELDDAATLFAGTTEPTVFQFTDGKCRFFGIAEWAVSREAVLFEHFEDWAIRRVHGWASVVGAVMGLR